MHCKSFAKTRLLPLLLLLKLQRIVKKGQRVPFEQIPGRGTWVQVCRGEITLNGQRMLAGDGAHAEVAGRLELTATEAAEILLFDLA